MAQLGSLAVDGDPRLRLSNPDFEKDSVPSSTEAGSGAIKPQNRRIHDAQVTFEEYYYHAQRTRAEEDTQPVHGRETNLLALIFPSKSDGGIKQKHEEHEKDPKRNLSNAANRATISDDEWTNASRALRTATKGAIFYLITTDILGPFGLPYAFATMGWG